MQNDIKYRGSEETPSYEKGKSLFVKTVNAMMARQELSHLVEWAIALHGMYESALFFVSILKQKNSYIVGCVECDI
jgi:hypothetical protein